jgi:hypothetical protein
VSLTRGPPGVIQAAFNDGRGPLGLGGCRACGLVRVPGREVGARRVGAIEERPETEDRLGAGLFCTVRRLSFGINLRRPVGRGMYGLIDSRSSSISSIDFLRALMQCQ